MYEVVIDSYELKAALKENVMFLIDQRRDNGKVK